MAVYIWPPKTISTLPPIGGATSANQVTEIARLDTLISNTNQKQISEDLYFNYNSTNISDSTYVEAIASTLDNTKGFTLFESGGYPIIVAFGASGSEVDKFLIPPGGFNGFIEIPIPAGTRISFKSLIAGQTINNGFLIANFLK